MCDKAGMFLAAPALEPHAKDRGVRRTRQPFEPTEARQSHPRVAVLRAGKGIASRQAVVHLPFVIGAPDGLD